MSQPPRNRPPRKPHRDDPRPASDAPRRPARAGWEPLADWYDGWMGGKDGSKHHVRLAVPHAASLLELQAGEHLIDIGCGQGVFAPTALAAEARYTGVDISPSLLELARQRHPKPALFLHGDACRLEFTDGLKPHSYDAALFLLSIQDIDPLDSAVRGASWALKKGGRVVFVMTHPAFRIPRQSGWGRDEGRKLTYRRIDRYLTPLSIPMKPYPGQSGVSISFHRPISAYVNTLGEYGLLIDAMREITSFKADDPEHDNPAEKDIPLFLALRARKV
jgi:ubiquinone/menaquinone biosynthesis C-methylase UbiE